MAEKADFLAWYGFYTRRADNSRMAGYRNQALLGGLVDYDPDVGVTCKLHYHPRVYRDQEAPRKAQMLVDYFISQGVPLTSTDTVVVIGGAFGWLGEALEDLVPGLEACSIDISQYVQDVKAISPDDELIESITAAGYDHTLANSVGEWLFNEFTDSRPRSRRPEMVAQNDLSTVKLRNDCRKLFQSNEVTRCITEEVWQLLTQEEKDRYTAAAADYGTSLTHIIDGIIA